MHPATLEDWRDTSVSLRGFARSSSGTDGTQLFPLDSMMGLVNDEVLIGGFQSEDELPARVEDSKTELDFRRRIRIELSQDVPILERLEVARNIVNPIQTCSLESLESLWEVMDDMTTFEANLELRKAAFCLLQASAIHVDRPSHRTKLFNMITTPVDHAAVNYQLSALNQLIQQGRQIYGLEAKLVNFLLGLVRGLFPSAEQARQDRHKGDDFKMTSKDPNARQRPEQEKALLNCLSLISTLIAEERGAFDAESLKAMLSSVTSFAWKTTGLALMRCFFNIISAIVTFAQVPAVNLEDCVRLLCRIMIDSRYKFRDDARLTLSVILHSDLWQESLDILIGQILVDFREPNELKCAILQLFADNSIHLKANYARLEVFSKHLVQACRSLRELRNASSDFIEPMVKLATECGVEIDVETFNALLGAIQAISKPSCWDRMSSRTINQSLIKLFLNCFLHSEPKTAILYNMLLEIATLPNPTPDKLDIFKLLARLRCDADHGIKIIRMPDSQRLAAVLRRTKATAVNVGVSVSPSSHTSSGGQSQPSKRGRSRASDFSNKTRSRSRSGRRANRFQDHFQSATESLWAYNELRGGFPLDLPEATSSAIYAQNPRMKNSGKSLLDIGRWLEVMIHELEIGNDWELYSFVLVHLPSQLSNCSLFEDHARQISDLHELLNTQLTTSSFPEPPPESGVRKGDIALCLYHSLAMLLAYQDFIGVRQWNRTVSTFRIGIERWDRVGKFCIHALALCCYEIPNIIENHITVIVEMMQKRITQADLAMDILEFLGGLARLPEAYDQGDMALRQKIFGICIRYLQHAREQRREHGKEGSVRANASSNRGSGGFDDAFRQSTQPQLEQTRRNLAEYVFTIAYQVIIFWFLAIDVRERHRHVGWITQELAFKAEAGKEEMDEQSLVLLDMIHRAAFSDMGETFSAPQFSDPERKVYKGSWLVGMSIVTAEVVMDEKSGRAECGQYTKRQASGTTHAVYYHNTTERPIHLAPGPGIVLPESVQDQFNLYPKHMMLQLISTISPVPPPLQPIPLPEDDDFTNRALKLFDSTDTVDGHKAAVIYIGDGQKSEKDILANTEGSEAYCAFLSRLGTKIPLKAAVFNTQGLDRQDGSDGSHTYAWRDRVTEIVFHIPTMMPNDLETDPSCAKKKAHIGNDHVKIIFNESGLPFEFNTFASDFNSVNIVITPEAHSSGASLLRDRSPQQKKLHTNAELSMQGREASATERFGYFLVQAFDSHHYPDFSPVASPKIISACALPGFVRQLAIAASVFCQVWQYKSLGEYTSSWRFRLQQILKLREKYAGTGGSTNNGYPHSAAEGPSSYVEGAQWAGSMAYGGLAEMDKLVASLDFTRWTR